MSSSSPEDIDAAERDRKSRQVELAISMLLRVGVAVSLLLIVGGSIVSFIRHPEYIHSRQDLARLTTPDHAIFPHTIHETIHGLAQGEGRSIIILGLMLLIATPVARVGISVLAFVYEKDLMFVVITSVVLAMLIASFFMGRIEA